MAPFRVFVSSPVYGIERYRKAVKTWAATAARNQAFDIFFYEDNDIKRIPGKSICESIFAHCGNYFDAFFVFFGDRIGQGTIDEFGYFEEVLVKENPACELWWTELSSGPKPQDVLDFIGRLQEYNTGIPHVENGLPDESSDVIAARFITKLFATLLKSQADALARTKVVTEG